MELGKDSVGLGNNLAENSLVQCLNNLVFFLVRGVYRIFEDGLSGFGHILDKFLGFVGRLGSS